MRIVTDGEYYAIQKGWIFKKYLSLYCSNNWWSLENSYSYCWGNKKRVEELYNFMMQKQNIRIVKED